MKCFIFLHLIILGSSSSACPSSKWFRFRSKCFLTHCCHTFHDSVNFCESQNATTVSILSEEENTFLKTKLLVNDGYWLGIKQVDFDNKTYEWLDGSPYNYRNWIQRIENNCSGAYIWNGEWYNDPQSCYGHGSAFCQIEIYSTIFKMLSQTMLETGNSNKEIKEVETRLKSTNNTFENALNTQKDLLTAMSSKFHSDLENTEHRINNFLVGLRQDLSKITDQTKFENENQKLANKELETRLSKWNEKLEDKMNLMNRSMTLLISDFELDLKNKEIQIKSTNKELVRQSLMMTRLENAIHTQNDLIARMTSKSESKSGKN